MTGRLSPILVVSEHVATMYRDDLARVAAAVQLVTHAPDGSWNGDPDTGEVVYLSSDMWRTRMGREVLRQVADWQSVQWVHTSSAGVEARVFAHLLMRGVTLTNAPGVNGNVIAQHVLALMLSHARRLDRYRTLQTERRWQWLQCEELTGATVLIVGLGGIGARVARLCRALDMRVIGVRRRAAPAPDVDETLPPAELPRGLSRADYVVLACPLTDVTRGLIGAKALAAMKSSAYLVNVARGPVVDTDALLDALRAESIAGAALDVFDREPLPEDSPLWSAPNLTITPHSAGSSPHNPERNARFFLANLERYVRGEPLQNVVTTVE